MKELKELKELHGWDDDDPKFIKKKAQIYKTYDKLAGKKKVSTAQKDAEEGAPFITLWEHVAELISKDFDKAFKVMIHHIPRGDWVADKWCRGGKVAYKGQPKCDWRRRQTKDGKQVVRLIQYKNIMILQKGVLLGAEDEKQQQQQQEEEEEEAAAEEEEEDWRRRSRRRHRRLPRPRRASPGRLLMLRHLRGHPGPRGLRSEHECAAGYVGYEKNGMHPVVS